MEIDVAPNITGSSPCEPIIGFSRAVRVGHTVHISGTGPVGADDEDAATQTRHILKIIQGVLEQAGATLEDVARTRMYLTHAEDWEMVGRVHGKFLGQSGQRQLWWLLRNFSIRHGGWKSKRTL